MNSKEDTTDKICHNVVIGFGSVRDVYSQAREKDSSITYNDVKQYMDKLNNMQVKFTYKKYNTDVPSHYLEELQCDLADLKRQKRTTDIDMLFVPLMCFLAMLGRYLQTQNNQMI